MRQKMAMYGGWALCVSCLHRTFVTTPCMHSHAGGQRRNRAEWGGTCTTTHCREPRKNTAPLCIKQKDAILGLDTLGGGSKDTWTRAKLKINRNEPHKD